MLTLKELQALDGSANDSSRAADRKDYYAQRLAAIRNGEKPLSTWLDHEGRYDKETVKLVTDVINEYAADLLRIAEMRLAAEARAFRISAQAKRDQLATIVAPESKS